MLDLTGILWRLCIGLSRGVKVLGRYHELDLLLLWSVQRRLFVGLPV